jgi:hypothetical protein
VAVLSDIRAGIAANINRVFTDAQCTGYLLTNPFAPAFEVELERIVYDTAMSRGLDEWFFTVRGFAASGTDSAAQMRLDPWLNSTGSQSVKTALEADRTLGGTVGDSHVIQISRIKVFTTTENTVGFFGAEWMLRALATGD